jgi:hypothetical protein
MECKPGDNLSSVIYAATSGTTFLLANGVYKVPAIIQMHVDNITIRSKSGIRDSVILDGNNGGATLSRTNFTPEIIAVSASKATIADITIRYASTHGIHAYAPASRGIDSLLIHNVRVYDCGEQLVKVNSNGSTPPSWVDRGILECSLLEFVDNSVMEPMTGGYYTGGLDVHGGLDWVIRGNTFRNIQRNAEGMEHAVHMWNKCRGSVVENNRFENVYRAVGFGMSTSPGSLERKYPDGAGDSPYFDHIGGMIRNNTVFNASGIHLETGVELMNVINTEVYHNTVVSIDQPFNSMEYRWPNTNVVIKNNLACHRIMQRDGAGAQLAGNLEYAPASLFNDYSSGNLHLASSAAAAIDKAVVLAAGKAGVDMDGKPHDATPDIGADEYGQSSVRSIPSSLIQGVFLLRVIKVPHRNMFVLCYTIPYSADVSVAIYDSHGKLVKQLSKGNLQTGSYKTVWSGYDSFGITAARGMYFVRIHAGLLTDSQKLLLLE